MLIFVSHIKSSKRSDAHTYGVNSDLLSTDSLMAHVAH